MLAIVGFVLTCSTAIQGQYLNPKITGKQITVRNLVMMPGKVEIVRQSVKGPEGMAAESDLLSIQIPQLIGEVLSKKSLAVWLHEVAKEDAQAKYTRADIAARYDALLPKITKKPKDVVKGRFSLGDEVLNLNLDKTADAIVFVRGNGQKLTKGKAAFSWLTLSLDLPYLALTIGVVDARTGEILMFTKATATADATGKNQAPIRSAIEKSLKKFPPAP
jgi:hypothetical protein